MGAGCGGNRTGHGCLLLEWGDIGFIILFYLLLHVLYVNYTTMKLGGKKKSVITE